MLLLLLSTLIRQRSVSGDPAGQGAVIDTVLRAVRAAVPGVGYEADLDGPLLFACHVDTVPVGASAGWSVDRFGGEIADGLVHGRGPRR